jgi:HEPN domain-containing protein
MSRASDKLTLARRHLDRVQSAWDEPDWDDLALYGFYCLEAAVEAAGLHFGFRTSTKHWEKVDLALRLHRRKGLPDISDLLRELNDARKAAAYGDIELPELDPEDTAIKIEEYVEAVAKLLEGKKK